MEWIKIFSDESQICITKEMLELDAIPMEEKKKKKPTGVVKEPSEIAGIDIGLKARRKKKKNFQSY